MFYPLAQPLFLALLYGLFYVSQKFLELLIVYNTLPFRGPYLSSHTARYGDVRLISVLTERTDVMEQTVCSVVLDCSVKTEARDVE